MARNGHRLGSEKRRWKIKEKLEGGRWKDRKEKEKISGLKFK
jgi:hypothetical protein